MQRIHTNVPDLWHFCSLEPQPHFITVSLISVLPNRFPQFSGAAGHSVSDHTAAATSWLQVRTRAAAGPKHHLFPAKWRLPQLSWGAGSRCRYLFHKQLHFPCVIQKGSVLALWYSRKGHSWSLGRPHSLERAPHCSRGVFPAGAAAVVPRSRLFPKDAAWGKASASALFPVACHRLLLCLNALTIISCDL